MNFRNPKIEDVIIVILALAAVPLALLVILAARTCAEFFLT